MRFTVNVSVGRLGASSGEIESLDMLVDTGSEMCMISQKMADGLGIVTTDTKSTDCSYGGHSCWPKGELDMIYIREDGEKIRSPFPTFNMSSGRRVS